MADTETTSTTPETSQAAAETPEAGFRHHISPKQYAEGLRAELRAAVTKEHKAAVQAELERLAAATTAPGATEQA